MYSDWKDVMFDFNILKNSTVLIIKNFEETINLNDEHIGITTNLFYSPYKGVFNEEIQSWKDTLEIVSESLENWMKLQITYM